MSTDPFWRADTPCRNAADPDVWFPEGRLAGPRLELAVTLCGGCPLRAECLAGALERGEQWGVWAGVLFEDGKVAALPGETRPTRKHPRAA